ncbi:N/A [soil metagenome]
MLPENLHKLFSPIAYRAGVYRRGWNTLAQQRGLTAVLCYHRVIASDDRRKAGLTVDEGITAATFEAQIRFMLRHFEPVEPASAAQPGPSRRPRFAVTFDDGYGDNHDVAAPILLRLGVPAAFYVVSECVGSTRRFWWDRLAAFVRDTGRTSLPLGGLLPDAASLPREMALQGGDARRAATDSLGAAFRQLDPTLIEPTLERLRLRLDVEDRPLAGDRLMDWSEVRGLAAQGFEIGAHSADHLNLACLDAAQLERQVAGAKQRIEAEIGRPVATFAYPYGGRSNFSAATMQAVRSAGYRAAFTAIPGVVSGDQEATALPRLSLNWPLDFACAHNVQAAIRATARAG